MWSLFVRAYDAVGGPDALARLLQADNELLSDARAIVGGDPEHGQDGSFWQFSTIGQVPIDEAVGPKLGSVLRTLRNGFAHSRWVFADLSALDYWQALGWEAAGADARFHLRERPARNHTLYVADAANWEPAKFWSMKDLPNSRHSIPRSSISPSPNAQLHPQWQQGEHLRQLKASARGPTSASS